MNGRIPTIGRVIIKTKGDDSIYAPLVNAIFTNVTKSLEY